jgi:hypothetical protein
MAGALAAPGPWEYLKEIPSGLGDMGREAAIRKTVEHLSIDAGSRTAFQAAARQSVKDMEQARALRSGEVSALGVVSPAVGEEFRAKGGARSDGAVSRPDSRLSGIPKGI